MPSFSKRSKRCLESTHPILQSIFNEVIKFHDCAILCGYRGKADQNRAYAAKASNVKWPDSAHNCKPSRGVDAYPYVNGGVSFDQVQCGVLAGIVITIAREKGVHDMIRWGGDWDGDQDTNDQKLHDLGHYEVKNHD